MPFRVTLTVISILAATVFCGLLHGRWTYRWNAPGQVGASDQSLLAIPQIIGDWRMTDDHEVSQQVLKTLQCSAHVFRTYVNDKTQQQVQMAIVAGPAGPISVHTPEICYSSRDFQQSTSRRAVNLTEESAPPQSGSTVEGQPSGEDSFWAVVFRTADVHAAPMSVYYGWSAGGEWQATDEPRHSFAGIPTLYKIQIAGLMPGSAVLGTASDPCYQFLQDFVATGWTSVPSRIQ